jgi:hypothetical protein
VCVREKKRREVQLTLRKTKEEEKTQTVAISTVSVTEDSKMERTGGGGEKVVATVHDPGRNWNWIGVFSVHRQ